MSYPAYDPNGGYDTDKITVRNEKYFEDDCCSCQENGMFAKPDNWLSCAVGVGALTIMVSTFLPYWRLDTEGTTTLEKYFDLSALAGFESRSYGLIHVRGTWSQSWTTLAQASCDIRNIGQITNIFGATYNWVSSGFDCSEAGSCCSVSSTCQGDFARAMHARCTEYQTMMRVSMVALFANFIACLMIAAGCTVFGLSKRKRTGGVAFGLWLFSSILCAIMGTVWALISDASFKELSQSSWYPYPSLGVAYYLHTSGWAVVMVCTIVFGFRVLPDVWKFDPAQEKLDKLQRKMDRKKDKEERHAKKKAELQGFIAAQQQPAPGYGNYAVQPVPYGVAPAPGGYMQQRPPVQPMPVQQQQLKGGYGNLVGQGGGVVVPGQTPQSQGAPQSGFGLPPAQAQGGFTGGPGYGQPNLSATPPGSQMGGTGGTGGTGGPGYGGPGYGGGQPNLSSMPPGTGGTGPSYGGGQPNLSSMPPGQMVPAGKPASGPGAGGFNWPAHQGAQQGDGETWNKMPAPPPSQQGS